MSKYRGLSPTNPYPLRYTVRMNAFDPIPLNTNWQMNDGVVLPRLSHWTPRSLAQGEKVELRQVFDLEPIGEVCLRFLLHIEAVPDERTVSMNSWDVAVGESGQGLVADVTDYVTLEDNVLLLTVNQNGIFGEVRLERVPCETV